MWMINTTHTCPIMMVMSNYYSYADVDDDDDDVIVVRVGPDRIIAAKQNASRNRHITYYYSRCKKTDRRS